VTVFAALANPFGNTDLSIWGILLAGYVGGLTAWADAESGPGDSSIWPVAGLSAPALYAWMAAPTTGSLLLGAGFLTWVTYCGYRMLPTGGRDIGGAVGGLLAGICLFDALVIRAGGGGWATGVALGCFGLTLLLHRYIDGT
ncbi:MAG: prenyltransferase, partial [Bradymonadaceae bacterium]